MQSTRRGSFSVHRSEKNPRFQIQLDKRPLSPGTSREASGVPCLNPRRGLTLLSPVCRNPAIGVGNQRYPAVPASTGDEALFQSTKPSGVPRGPSHLQFPWLLRATMRSPLRSPAQVEGTQGFLPQPGKALERTSSTRLEARFPYHGSGAMTRSPSPLAWRPDFPDRKSTRLNSSHQTISYAVFCLKKKKKTYQSTNVQTETKVHIQRTYTGTHS